MGNAEHFIGIVKEKQIHDLFGEHSFANNAAYPQQSIVEQRQGKVTILAQTNSAEASLYLLAAEQGLDPIFPKEVEEQVHSFLQNTGIEDSALKDMSALPFVTIDGADSMDLDQAIYVEENQEGYIVHYALADASYYVSPGTPIYNEALRRGASYYLPGFMVPMLPRALSEGLVSLNANVRRRAVVFSMHLDKQGRCTQTQIQPSRICSQGKLSFGGVQNFYEGGPGFGSDIDQSLTRLKVVGQLRMNLAEERGVVRYRRHEVKANLSIGGVRFSASQAVRREVELFNEQISLLCNIEGARYLAAHGADFVEPIYRVHPSPSKEKMQDFEDMLASLTRTRSLDKTRWQWTSEGAVPLRQYLEQLPKDGPEGRIAMAIHRQAVMANVRSTFQTEASGHHGVGAEVYARFSAPMREIVGVFLHRELLEAKAGHGHADAELRTQVVSKANAAKSTQRTVSNKGNRLILEQIFTDALAHQAKLKGTLMGAQGSKAYVRLDTPPIDIKVYVKLAPTRLRVSKDGSTLLKDGKPMHTLGDEVGIEVIRKDEDRDRWILELHPSKE